MSETAKLFKDMGATKLAIIALVTVAVFAAIIFFSINISKPAVVPLFSGLESGDSNKISAKLESMGVYYEVLNGGSQIMVPRDKVLSVRMGLAEEGLPSGRANIGYEIFDKSESIGVSNFVNNVNMIRALEGELGRTIGSFNQVESARVHLVIPKQDIFSKRKSETTASVVLKMRGNQPLEQSQISAIAHLVTTAVPDLSMKKITIVDTQGRPFKKGGSDDDDPGVMASTNEEFKIQYEKRIKNVIEDLLSRSVGAGRVEAQVSAEMDFDREVVDSELFDPNGQVARSTQTVEEKENSKDGAGGGNVSAANNLPGGDAGAEAAAGSATNNAKVDEITNFEVSKTVKKHIKETGAVKKISIAVLVDGNYAFNEATEETTYTPRADDELKQLEALVKSAVGYDEKRGDSIKVINMRFSTDVQGAVKEKKFEWVKRDLGSIIQTLVIGIVITLIILLIVKPMVGRAFEITKSETDEAELQAALAGQDLEELAQITGQEEEAKKKESLIDMERFEERMNTSSLSAINGIVERHPEESVTILRGWMENNA
jgi:flagellar M-ring protein FliF